MPKRSCPLNHSIRKLRLRVILGSKLGPSPSPSVFGVCLHDLSFAPHLLLLVHDPLFTALDIPLPSVAVHGFSHPAAVFDIDIVHPRHGPRDVSTTDTQHEIGLDVLGATVVLEDAGAETGSYGGLTYHSPLLLVLRVELAHGAPSSSQRGVQAVEKPAESAFGAHTAGLGVAEPLDGTDADGGVERARAERYALPHVGEEEIALDTLALQGDVQHAGGDVHADPDVAVFREYLAGETGATAYVEYEGRVIEIEKFEGAVGHGRLDGLDT